MLGGANQMPRTVGAQGFSVPDKLKLGSGRKVENS